ncbi:putative short-chain type dehydrogenase/reductase [Serendipita vermifera]|nr:putative short-chain type dehydrogenase/reductase [Serendipita vermifera]
MSSLSGKVAIVTGSARGIGASIAVGLAKEGANVVVNYVSPSSKALAEKVAQEAEGYGSKALVVQANLGSLSDIDKLVDQTVAQFSKIDILVNNGAVLEFGNIGNITPESFSRIYEVNVRGTIFLSQAVIPHMGDGGRIINVSSVAARQAAVESITRVMGSELRDKGIRVNTVNPGPVVTDMLTAQSDEPADITDAILFLAGPKSRWINGGTLSTNNGAILNYAVL